MKKFGTVLIVVGFFLLLGTFGALEQDNITVAQTIYRGIIWGFGPMILGGVIINRYKWQ